MTPGDAYGALYRRLLWPAWESGLRRRPTLRLLRTLEASQWCPPDVLLASQAGELRRLLRHACAKVPFYRERFSAAGLSPEDVRGPADLARLPILTRAEAQASLETRRSGVPPLPEVWKTTGGTTGEPLRIGYDWGSEHWRQATKLRGYGWAGFFPGDRALYFWGFPTRRPALLQRAKIALDRRLRRERYLDCTARGEGELARAVELVRRMRPRVLVCYTQAGADLARYVLDRGLRDWDAIAVLCCAERLSAADRRVLVDAFGPDVFETYGSREVMLIGAECEAHQGLHLSLENLICEVVVRGEGGPERPAAPGESGEVVITDLHNYGMPLVRYALGDVAVAGSSEPCPCGRTLPRLGAVEGRVTETLRDASGQRVSGMLFNLIFSPIADKVGHFQAVQHRDGSITLRFVRRQGFDEAAGAHIQRQCDRFLRGVPVRMEAVPEIPPGPGGKRKVVVVEG